MKHWKRLLAVAAAVVMAMALAIPAFAATSDASDSYKVAKVEVSDIAAGNTLTLYKIVQFNYDAATNAFDYTLATGLPAAYDTVDELAALAPNGYTLAAATDTIRIAADTLAYGIADNTITPIGTAVTAVASSDGKATIENLPAGWYVAVVTGTNDTSYIYQNMIVNALPVVDSENNTFKPADNVTFEVKHTTDTITKTVGAGKQESTDQYSVGDSVPFEITTAIPNYPNPAKIATFKITDVPRALTDDVNSVVVTVNGAEVTKCESLEAVDATFTVNKSGDGFVIEFAKDYILAHPGQAVVVNYNATIKSDAVVAANGLTADNTANITFNPNPNDSGIVEPEDETELYTYGVDVFKYKADTNPKEKLTGAKFILYKADGTTVAGEEKEVDENGYVSWSGLAAGTYKLVETKAPAGYKLDSTPMEITISKDTAAADNRATVAEESNFFQKDVPNVEGTTLPSTGGIGTTILYIIGGILVLGAVVFLITKRRMGKESNVEMVDEK